MLQGSSGTEPWGKGVDYDEEAFKEAYEAMLTWADSSDSEEDQVRWC